MPRVQILNITHSINKLIEDDSESLISLKCPELIHRLFQEVKYIHLNLNKITKSYIIRMLIDYELIIKDSIINVSEIENNVKVFNNLLYTKQEQASLENKKLLVVLGEAHNTQESLMNQFIISIILKDKGFNSVLIEQNNEKLKNIMNNSNKFENIFNFQFFSLVLNMSLSGIDPYNQQNKEQPFNLKRNKEINKAIASFENQDQLAIVGNNHLSHIINSKIIQDKFVVLPITSIISQDKFLMMINFIKTFSYKEVESVVSGIEVAGRFPFQEITKLNFNDVIEGFSIHKLLNIIIDLLPSILNFASFPKDTIYYSDFSMHFEQCIVFDSLSSWIEGLTEDFIALAGNTNEL